MTDQAGLNKAGGTSVDLEGAVGFLSDGSFVEYLMPEGKALLYCGYEAALNNVWVDQVGLNVDSV